MPDLTPGTAVDKVRPVPESPLTPPAFRQLFDAKVAGVLLGLVVVGVISCDLVTRAVSRKLQTVESAPDLAAWSPGSVVRVRLALKTQDAERHVCALAQTFDGLRCEHDGNKKKLPREPSEPVDDNLRSTLQPFKTAVGDHALLVAGLWYTPELAFRRHSEPARERRGQQLQTFYADCELESLGRVESVEVRYDFGKSWSAVKDVPVARAKRCTIVYAPELAAVTSVR